MRSFQFDCSKKNILGKPYCVKSTFFFIHSLVFYNIFHKRFLYKPELSVASRGGKYHISLPGCPRQRQRSGKPKSLWYNNFQIFTCKRAVIQSSAVESLVIAVSAAWGDPLQVAAMHCRPGERRSESSGRHSELTASLISVNIVGNKAGPEIALVAHRPHHAAERLSGPA